MSVFFSLIIPVYNVAKYLDAAVDSIMRQDFPADQFEVICVDDGSTDGSPERLDYFKQKYHNLQVVHQKNCGVSIARNVGLSQANGEYIWFIDSDDLIAPDALSCIYSQIQKHGYPERLKFGIWACYETVTYEECCRIRKEQQIPNYDYHNNTVLTSVLSRRYILDHAITFDPTMTYAEDTVFMMTVLSGDPSNFEIKDILYFHRQNPTSLMSSHDEIHTRKRIDSEIKAAKHYRQLMKVPSRYHNDIEKNFGYSIIQALSRIQDLGQISEKKYLKEMHAEKLFPCKIRPDCIDQNIFSGRSHESLYFFLYCHLSTVWGYYLMNSFKKLASVKRSITASRNNEDKKV